MAVVSTRSRRTGRAVVATFAVVAALALSGCAGQKVAGKPRALGAIDPGTVAGLPVTDGPSGPKRGVADSTLPVENADGGEMDKVAVNAVSDVQEYWKERFRSDFRTEFKPISRLLSYDSNGRGVQICRSSTEGQVNAFYCPLDDAVAWDRGELLPMLNKRFGPMAVVTVLAHEVGHAVQSRLATAGAAAGIPDDAKITASTPTIVAEQQADCYAGAFFRHVAEGKSKHFEISTGKGLNQILASLFFIRDQVGSSFAKQGAHGSAFDRITGFQYGFAEGPTRCSRIGVKEIENRITELPFIKQDDQKTGGNIEINDKNLEAIKKSLGDAFKDTGAAAPTFRDASGSCSDAKPTKPAGYCPSSNTVSLDMAELARIGTPPKKGDRQSTGIGDFAAYGEVASRYVLSVQKAVGSELKGDVAGLRTACLVGSWAGQLLEHPVNKRNPLPGAKISPGDLDEAVAELLSERSLIAADVDGRSVPSGFARVEALRVGFMDGVSPCTEKFN
ncbi:neutral zinc metallopeptidase [Streptoalloteichus hindustanus]|uniref:Predicted metalloprotease n=1 Tax=Streptoalloteichus hindustanus TaxID=2017 RepID=A0A1M5GJ64_STRHI|nr:neutral zinc metallopeptidase [Streptoalloteichus hindustanus]SHG03759.1 Predicted metalloprotease [Streptoalloteichus hindustanus]